MLSLESIVEPGPCSLQNHSQTMPTQLLSMHPTIIVQTADADLQPIPTSTMDSPPPSIEMRQFSPHQLRTTPTRWPFVASLHSKAVVGTSEGELEPRVTSVDAPVPSVEARQFSLHYDSRTTPTRWPFVTGKIAARTVEGELQPQVTSMDPSIPSLDARQFSLGPHPRTTPTRWPFVTIKAISTSAQVSYTLDVVPTAPPSLVDKQVHGAPCSPEGQWLCAGSSYQRCASGQWSQVMPLAEGMSCALYGIGSDINGGGGSGGSSGSNPLPYRNGTSKKAIWLFAVVASALIGAWL